MAFNFGAMPIPTQPQNTDWGSALAQVLAGAQQGPPVAAANDPGPAPQPAPQVQDQSAPAPDASQAPQAPSMADIPVSPLETMMAWAVHGGTLGEAAQIVRATKLKNLQDAYALQKTQEMYRLMGQLGDRDRLDFLANPEKFAESDAKNLEPQKAGPDDTVIFRTGPQNAGGSQFTGRGTYSVSPTGVISNSQTGVAGRVALPETVAGKLYPFMPGISGVGAQAPVQTGWTSYGQPAQPSALNAISRVTGIPTPSAHPASQATPQGASAGLDGGQFFKSFVLPHEGGLNPHDMNGAPTKYGINQTANPGVNVANLTPAQAQDIFVKKYWGPSGAANMPAPLAAVHADTYFINPKMAQTFLKQSGGDPNAYLGLRESWMQNMLQNNPAAAPYAKAWGQRNADLQSFINSNGGASTQGGAQLAQNGVGDIPTQIGQPVGQGPGLLSPDEVKAAGFPTGSVVQRDPEGKLTVIQSPEYSPEAKSNLRNHVLTSDEYKQAQAAMAAYKAMTANARTMTGPSAYAMLDTFARAINPGAVARPQVIQTIEQNLGLPAQLIGSLESKFGQGNLPKEVRQQIIDAVVPFAQAHWDQANMLNQANAALAKAHGFDAADVTAPLEGRPGRYSIAAAEAGMPQRDELVSGRVYATPRGRLKWTGTGFVPAGGR